MIRIEVPSPRQKRCPSRDLNLKATLAATTSKNAGDPPRWYSANAGQKQRRTREGFVMGRRLQTASRQEAAFHLSLPRSLPCLLHRVPLQESPLPP